MGAITSLRTSRPRKNEHVSQRPRDSTRHRYKPLYSPRAPSIPPRSAPSSGAPMLPESMASTSITAAITGEGLAKASPCATSCWRPQLSCSPAGKIVIAHIGAARMEDALRFSAHAADAGAHGGRLACRAWWAYEMAEIRAYCCWPGGSPPGSPCCSTISSKSAPALKSEQVAELCALPNVAGRHTHQL